MGRVSRAFFGALQSQGKFAGKRGRKGRRRTMERLAQGLLTLLVVFLLLFSCIPQSLASPKKASSVARKEDIPFVKCQVCEKIAHQIYHQVKKESQISPKKVSKFQIIELAENACSLKKEEADWLLQIDIAENGDKLELVDQGTEGQCISECKTIEVLVKRSWDTQRLMLPNLYLKPSPRSFVGGDFLCNDLSKACSVKPPPVPKGRIAGERFVVKSSKDAEMEKILRSMEGMPGHPTSCIQEKI